MFLEEGGKELWREFRGAREVFVRVFNRMLLRSWYRASSRSCVMSKRWHSHDHHHSRGGAEWAGAELSEELRADRQAVVERTKR